MIVVTGATGHIGNVLVRELLARGKQVRALVLPSEDTGAISGLDVDVVRGDILDPDSLDRAFSGAEAVYHVAGLVVISPEQEALVNRVNVEGTINVIAAVERAGVKKLVYTSSIHSLVEPPKGRTIDESCGFDPNRSRGGYDRSKAHASLAVLNAAKRGLNAVIVCPTGVIGPYDYRVSIMGQVLLDLASGSLRAVPEGAYDFVDVRDVAIGHILACEKGRPGETYILSGECITVANLGRVVDEVSGRRRITRVRIPAWLARVAAHVAMTVSALTRIPTRITKYSIETLLSNCDISSAKARRELGYSPRPLRDSISDSLRWFAEQRKARAVFARQPGQLA